MNKVLIKGDSVGDADLDILVRQIAALKGADVAVEKQFIVTSDSPALLAALRALFGDTTIAAETKVKRNIERVQKRSKMVQESWAGNGNGNGHEPAIKPEPTRGPHVRSISVNGSGEMISRFELNKRLREKTIDEGTELHSPKYGRMVVFLDGDELALQNEQGKL